MDALISNRVEFVKLLLAKGFSMEEFLTNTRLRRLYALAAKVSAKYKQLLLQLFIMIMMMMMMMMMIIIITSDTGKSKL